MFKPPLRGLFYYLGAMTIQVFEEEDGFIISWDANNPQEAVLGSLTQEDFTKFILDACEKVLAKHTFESEFMEK